MSTRRIACVSVSQPARIQDFLIYNELYTAGTYVKRSAKVFIRASRYSFGKGGGAGSGLQAIGTESVPMLTFWIQVYHFYKWAKKKKVGRVAISDESIW